MNVRASVEGSQLSIAIEDSGVGMAEEVAQRISETNFFYQGDSSRTKRFGGIGLGLAITCKLVKAMGGSLDIDSVEGQGSTVTVHVPIRSTWEEKNSLNRSNSTFSRSSDCSGISGHGKRSESGVVDAVANCSGATSSALGTSLRSSMDSDASDPDDQASQYSEEAYPVPGERSMPCVKNVVCLVDVSHGGLNTQVRNTLAIHEAIVVSKDHPDAEMAEVMITTAKEALRERRLGRCLPVVYLARPSERENDNLLPIDCSQLDLAPLKSMELLNAVAYSSKTPLSRLSCGDRWLSRRSDVSWGRVSHDGTHRSSHLTSQRSGRRNGQRKSIDNSLLLPVMRSSFYRSDRVSSNPDFHRRTPKSKPRNGKVPRILIAEDNDINIKICLKILEHVCGDDIRPDIVRNGREALEALERDAGYDLVLMDIHMPDMDGIRAAKELRKRSIMCPIVALSADTASEVQQECLRSGMQAFLCKPLKVKDIKDVLATMHIDTL